MPTLFNSASLFASGPHRFRVAPMGSQVIENTTVSPTTPGRQAIGPLTDGVTVRGRLVAESDAALWALIDAITLQITEPSTAADLADPSGRVFADMAFVTFTLLDSFHRGRTVSVPYEAVFLRLP